MAALLLAIAAVAWGDTGEDYYHKGVVIAKQGRPAEAINYFDKAIELEPMLAAAYFARGVARQAGRDSRGSIGDYTKAIQINPAIIKPSIAAESQRLLWVMLTVRWPTLIGPSN
jgi:tetratricopeptide (TPR) repeat protein